MKSLRTFWPSFIVIVLTALSGVIAGALSNRWGVPAGMKLSAARLAELPDEFGDWKLQATFPIEPDVIEMLQSNGNVHHVYRNRETGQIVNAAILLGPPGPISAHTPEICFASQDFEQLGPPRRHHIDLAGASAGNGVDSPAVTDAAVWRLKFRSRSVQGQLLGVAYAWNSGKGWLAPDSPRVAFAGWPLLYKLQLSAPIDTSVAEESGDPCESFLKEFLPVCNSTLFSESSE